MLELDRSRKNLVSHLVEVATEAGRVLVHGPWGVGKTTLLLETAREARRAGVRVSYRSKTHDLGDVVAALEEAYGERTTREPTSNLSARQRKSSLRLACNDDRGLLLLDGFRASGTALIGFLRSVRGKQLAVIAAADVQHPRDLASARAMSVAYREIAVPPLSTRVLDRYLDQLVSAAPPLFELSTGGRRALLRVAQGCPGILERAWARLQASRYWRDGLPLTETLIADLRIEWLTQQNEAAPRKGRLN